MPKNRFYIEIIILCLLLSSVVWLSLRVFGLPTKLDLTPTQTEAPTPTPPPTATDNVPTPKPTILPLPTGPQTYNFSHGTNVKGPKISKITIDPLAPSSTQSITLSAKHTQPISSITIEVITDNQKVPHTLELISGSNTDGTWQGSWSISDTYSYKYGFHLKLNSNSNYDNTMWIRN